MNHSEPFCGTTWNTFQYFVTDNSVRLYTILMVHFIGSVLNALIVIIFTKNTVSSSNLLFASLAISDSIVLIVGYPRLWIALSHHIRDSLNQGSYTKAESLVDHYLYTFQKIFYHVSVYQTMTLTIWRYIAITYPLKERSLCNLKTTFFSIVTVYVLCTLCFMPELLGLNVPSIQDTVCGKAVSIKNVTRDELQKVNTTRFLKTFSDLVYIVILKIVPCSVVAVCTVKFIQVLRKSKTLRKQMIATFNGDLPEKEKQMNRTTKMVLGITIFFLSVNALMTVARILVIIYGDKFRKDCFPGMKCVNNYLAIIYVTIPLTVYYITSRQFRDNFKSLLYTGRRTMYGVSIKSTGSFDFKTSTSTLPSISDSSATICRGIFWNNDVTD